MRVAVFMIAACAFAQVEAPSIGVMLDAAGAFRTVYGVAGNFTLGPPLEEAVPDPLPGTVSADDAGIVLRRRDASEVRFALPGVVILRTMSAEWVQAITRSGSFALRIEAGKEALFALPGSPAPAAVREVRRR
jgi:hypothetical protein